MKESGKKPPPAFIALGDILTGFDKSYSGQIAEIRRPKNRVRVSKRRRGLATFGKLLSLRFPRKKTDKEPNCARKENIKANDIRGNSVKTVYVNCRGCKFSADLLDKECRFRCMQLLGREHYERIILDDGFYKRDYGPDDTGKLRELLDIAEGLDIRFPEECGLCAKEHEKQIRLLKEALMRDPIDLLHRGIEIKENEDITVIGVEKEVCEECRRRVEAVVRTAITRLKNAKLGKSYVFSPIIRPFFSNSRILFSIPSRDKIQEIYENSGSRVVLFRGDEEMYFIFPPEYGLNRQQLEIMKLAYDSISRREGPQDEKAFTDLCRSEIIKAASKKGYEVSVQGITTMTEVMTRCTRGLDIVELLLRDPNLQDVYINSPIETTPLYVKHQILDDCRTNVYLTEETARNMVSKFRLRSGRAFSEVSPVLDMELPEFGVRVNITGPPVSPDGLAFAFRRANDEPWTLLRFIENRMISPMAAGLLGMMVGEESTILMCGDRGSGKTSMLTALIGAMPAKYRILTMEDTFEIPVPTLTREGGFRIQRMRIRPSTAGDSLELSADEAMRSLLRMGDSAIVIGEVRGREACTLYEAMNVGGSGNCVLGTIHAKSPRSLLERVVFSLGVPPQSFKATDLVVIADRIRPGGGTQRLRRVTEIAEVRKDWNEVDADKVFSTLMNYDRRLDQLVIGETLRYPERSDVICRIAAKRGVTPAEILKDIEARGNAYGYAVRLFWKTGDKGLLSLRTMVDLNHRYLELVDESIAAKGKADYNYILDRIIRWLDEYARKRTHGKGAGKYGIEPQDGLCRDVQESTQITQEQGKQ